jgi:sugar phosphate isomerase/epimerase
MTVEDTLKLASISGIPFLDIMVLSKKDLPKYIEAMKKYPVKVKCYISNNSFFRRETVITKQLDEDMEKAKKLGAELFMIVPMYNIGDPKKATRLGRTKVQDIMTRYFMIAVEKGKKIGLKVCFETTPRDEVCLSGTQDCLKILTKVPGLGLILDTANMLPHGDTPMEAYEILKDYIVHVHLKEVALTDKKFPKSLFMSESTPEGKVMKVVVFGEGCIPVKDIYSRMEADGYTGTYALEYAHPDGGACGIEKHIPQVKLFVDYLK